MRATLHLVNREFEALADDFVTLGMLPKSEVQHPLRAGRWPHPRRFTRFTRIIVCLLTLLLTSSARAATVLITTPSAPRTPRTPPNIPLCLALQGEEREAVVPALTGVFAEALKGGVSNLSFGDLSGQLGA